jgi:hypothetical protein
MSENIAATHPEVEGCNREARLFAALWCHPDTIQIVNTFIEEVREISIGWSRMGKAAGMSPAVARLCAQKLIARKWMERMMGPSYELHIGTTYRLYAGPSRTQERRNGTL